MWLPFAALECPGFADVRPTQQEHQQQQQQQQKTDDRRESRTENGFGIIGSEYFFFFSQKRAGGLRERFKKIALYRALRLMVILATGTEHSFQLQFINSLVIVLFFSVLFFLLPTANDH